MLVPESGQVKSFRLSSRTLAASAFFVFALGAFGVWGAYSAYSGKKLVAELQAAERFNDMAQQRRNKEVEHLNDLLKAEQQKTAVYARHLGQMQARLARLDAVGEKLVQVAKLDKNDFDFSVMPAMGGPRIVPAGLGADLSMPSQIQQMNSRLSHLDVQLAAIDMILQENCDEAHARPHAWPTEGGWLSSHYGMRIDPFTGTRAMHRGVDIANRFGAPVLAASRGVVVFAGKSPGFGTLVEVEHGYGFRTRYGHLSSIAVKVGDEVSDGDLLGRVGSSGRSTGPHLHFEVHRYGKDMDPAPYLPRS
jgi:murein DD-endopeptidase MepM/ murein hydrolase activator NlpD